MEHGLIVDARGGMLEFCDTDESIMIRIKFEEGGHRCAECLHYYSKAAFSKAQLSKGASRRWCKACIQARADHYEVMGEEDMLS